MARELKVEIVGDASSLHKALGQAGKSTDGFGGKFAKLGKTMAVAAGAAGVAIGALAVKSIGAASDLSEQLNKTAVVFGRNGQEVAKWSAGLSESFGLSQRAALEAAGTYGNMLVPMGFARDEAAGMSKKFVELAADMASFNNASPEETLDALRAGLAGETEPLRRFGVFLNDARIKQEAVSQGAKLVKGQLDAQSKATAIAAIIMKDTADTQGDFGRTSGSLANQQRILRAQIENVGAAFGKAFLPIAIKVLQFVTGHLIPGISNAVGAVTDWYNALSKRLAKAPTFRAKLNVIFEGVEKLAGQFVDGVISRITALLPQKEVPLNFKLQHRGGETAAGGVDWDAVAEDVLAGFTVALEKSTKLAKALANTVTEAIRGVPWADVGKEMGPGLAAAVAAAFVTLLDPAFWLKNWDLALAIAVTVFGGAIGRAALAIGARLASALLGVIARISPEFAAAFGRLMDDALRFFLAVFNRVWPRITATMSNLVGSLFGKLTRLAVFTIKVLGVQAAIDAVGDFARWVAGKLQEIISWVGRLPGKFAAAFSGAGTWLYNAGLAILQGLWDGLKAKWDAVAGWLGGLGGQIRSLKGPPAKDAVLLQDIGQLIMGGLATGLSQGFEQRVKPFLAGLSDKFRDSMTNAMDAAITAINNKKSAFEAAFSDLSNLALQAFDKIASEIQTKSEKALAKMDAKKAAQALKDALNDANEALAKAKEDQAKLNPADFASPEEFAAAQAAATQAVIDAEKQRQDALDAITHARLEARAAKERKDLDDRLALKRQHFQNELTAIQNAYANGRISAQQFHEKLIGLFKQYKIPYNKGAEELGLALAEGLNQSFKKVQAAARALAQEVVDQFANIRVIINVDLSTKGGDGKKLPKRAAGGPVVGGKAYLVGEAGPEVFIPSVSGRINPNTSSGSGFMGGGTLLQVNLSGTFFGDNRDEIADAMADSIHNALLRKQRRTGSLGIA